MLKAFLTILIGVTTVFGITVGGIRLHRVNLSVRYNFDYLTGGANKVILFVGDGMGDNHVSITEAYYEKEMFFTSFEKQGHVSTSSLDVLKSTDSASSATAFATGNKVYNKEISTRKGTDLPNLTEYLKEQGLGVGLISTDSLSSQTIAAFSSHTSNEENTEEIILEQTRSGVDLFLGSGRDLYRRYKDNFISESYSYYDKFENIDINQEKIIGVFDEEKDETTSKTIPTLDKLTKLAVDFMENNFPNGYFLVVECGHIDKMSHNVNILDMVQYLENFDKAIAGTYESLKDDPTCTIIVASNHETGRLVYNGETKEQINSMDLITYDGHTLVDVPYYMYFGNKELEIDKISNIIDNTDIYKICKALLSD
jgi:alkaline phosphatase